MSKQLMNFEVAAKTLQNIGAIENILVDLQQSKHRRGSSQQSKSNETRKMKNKRKAARKMRKRNHK